MTIHVACAGVRPASFIISESFSGKLGIFFILCNTSKNAVFIKLLTRFVIASSIIVFALVPNVNEVFSAHSFSTVSAIACVTNSLIMPGWVFHTHFKCFIFIHCCTFL